MPLMRHHFRSGVVFVRPPRMGSEVAVASATGNGVGATAGHPQPAPPLIIVKMYQP